MPPPSRRFAIPAFDASYAWERIEDSRTASTAFSSAFPPLTPRAVLKVQGVRFRQTIDRGPRSVEGVVKWFLEMLPLRAARLLKEGTAPADRANAASSVGDIRLPFPMSSWRRCRT
jgi:hypothetical protein